MNRSSRLRGFTLIELLTVMVIILILAALVLALVGYANGKASQSKATAEMSAMSTAMESYKTDNGTYPRNSDTDTLDAKNSSAGGGNPGSTYYISACRYLYICLTGDTSGNRGSNGGNVTYSKTYYDVPVSELKLDTSTSMYYILDPYGNSYGYSTVFQKLQETAQATGAPAPTSSTTAGGYNPTFDLWSTGGYGGSAKTYPTDLQTPDVQSTLWIKNW